MGRGVGERGGGGWGWGVVVNWLGHCETVFTRSGRRQGKLQAVVTTSFLVPESDARIAAPGMCKSYIPYNNNNSIYKA